MWTLFRTLRIISAIILFFFCWTYLPLYSFVAYAAEKKSGVSSQESVGKNHGAGARGKGQVNQGTGSSSQGSGKAEERFEKALEDIREKVGKAEEKTAKNKDAAPEIEAIKAKRSEIDKLDVEFKKEFAATEKKLRDANLPKEILDRHYKFVKHHEDNLKEVKTNLVGPRRI